MRSILDFPSIGPYMGVTRDKRITFKNGRNFRVIVYGAFNAFGLIGPEKNGVAVLDEDSKQVLCDEISLESSGYFGPSNNQLATFEELTESTWTAFKKRINGHKRARYAI